jgi:hypothetical protein
VGRFLIAAVAVGLAIGCDNPPEPANSAVLYVHSSAGFVRSIDFHDRSFVFETDGGFTRAIHLCDGTVPVWVGMHADIAWHWDSMSRCDHFDGVTHLPPDARAERELRFIRSQAAQAPAPAVKMATDSEQQR